MRHLAFAALFMVLAAATANAGETGIINQAGPYESTMRFYLHPAHGFPGTPQATQPSAAESKHSNGNAKQPVKRDASAQHSFGVKTRYAANAQTNPR